MDLPINYRSAKEIVDLANAIQKRRNEVTSQEFTHQKADRSAADQLPWIYVNNNTPEDEEVVEKILLESPKVEQQ